MKIQKLLTIFIVSLVVGCQDAPPPDPNEVERQRVAQAYNIPAQIVHEFTWILNVKSKQVAEVKASVEARFPTTETVVLDCSDSQEEEDIVIFRNCAADEKWLTGLPGVTNVCPDMLMGPDADPGQ